MGTDAAAYADAALRAALGKAGISKAGGGVPVAVMRAALEGMAEQFTARQAEAVKALRDAAKLARRQQQVIDRLADLPDPAGPFKGGGLVPYEPGQWRTELRPAFPPQRMNGHSHNEQQ